MISPFHLCCCLVMNIVHIFSQNTVSVTMGVEAIDIIDGSVHGNVNRSRSMENEVHAEVKYK